MTMTTTQKPHTADSTPAVRLFSPDRTLFTAFAWAFLILSPFSVPLFSIGGRYLAEVPLLLFVLTVLVIGGTISRTTLMRTLLCVSASAALLAPFFLLGMASGATFTDAYSDFRAMMALFAISVILFSVPEQAAVRFVVLASFFSLILYTLGNVPISSSVLGAALREPAKLGKITYPVLGFVAACLFFAYRSRTLLLLTALSLFFYLALQTAYRYVYLTFGLTVTVVLVAPLLRHRRIPTVAKLLLLSLGLYGAVEVVRDDTMLVDTLYGLSNFVYNYSNVPDELVHQTVTKSIQSLEGDIGVGDAIYLSYLYSLLDVGRFAIPHGLGHLASVGDPVIFGGNTIDNSFVFVNYHFGVLVTALLGLLVIWAYLRRTRRGFTATMHMQVMVMALPVLFALYFRAVPFVDVAGAASFAFVIRLFAYFMDSIVSDGPKLHDDFVAARRRV